MTTDLEKTFFDTFEIKPYGKYYNCKLNLEGGCKPEKSCCTCEHSEEVYCYPPITDSILLELLVIMTRYTDIIEGFDSVQELKEFVLKDLMYSLTQPECNIVKQQVQAIFKV